MYWVFNEDQAKAAMKSFVERTCADQCEQAATATLLAEFLTSPEAREHKLVQDSDSSNG
jgi:hypothetical protein